VWVVPIVIATAVVGYRERNVFLLAISGAGVAITEWPHIETLPSGHESSVPWWSQLVGTSYVWWALTATTVIGLTVGRPSKSEMTRAEPAPATIQDAPR
jgi:alpha-1,2-mannosyltransferase